MFDKRLFSQFLSIERSHVYVNKKASIKILQCPGGSSFELLPFKEQSGICCIPQMQAPMQCWLSIRSKEASTSMLLPPYEIQLMLPGMAHRAVQIQSETERLP